LIIIHVDWYQVFRKKETEEEREEMESEKAQSELYILIIKTCDTNKKFIAYFPILYLVKRSRGQYLSLQNSLKKYQAISVAL
jgi:hypothetical protein